MKTMSESARAWAIFSESSSAARAPIALSPPAPRPRVILSPIRILCGASDWRSAWASVLQAMNSTPIISARIIRLTALLPPPPTPMTRMSAKFSESDRNGIAFLRGWLAHGDGRTAGMAAVRWMAAWTRRTPQRLRSSWVRRVAGSLPPGRPLRTPGSRRPPRASQRRSLRDCRAVPVRAAPIRAPGGSSAAIGHAPYGHARAALRSCPTSTGTGTSGRARVGLPSTRSGRPRPPCSSPSPSAPAAWPA